MERFSNDKYEILGLLGCGGLGSVYWGKTRPEGAPVVFKTVVGNVGTPRYLDREYRVLSKLSHPNIVQVYEQFVLDGTLWIAMERIDGVSLFEALPRAGASALSHVAARVFGQLQNALEYLHDHRIVHGDLSPGNLLVDPYGVLKLVDFEHSRLLGVDESEYWPAGSIAGTPLYMSPEHLSGSPTVESDYFVVGTLLLEHLSGRNPFHGPDFASVLRAIATADASHLLAPIPQVDPQLRDTILSLLAESPSGRHPGWDLLRMVTRHYTPFEPSPAPVETRMKGHPSVFISHSSLDKQIAGGLALELAKRGVDVWLDEWAIQVGDSISRRVEEALENCTYVILLLSPGALASNWVDKEWRAAFSREMSRGEVTVLPVLAAKCELPPLLRDRKYADISESFERGVNELVRLLGKD
ncbi:MAG: TIR domain-containing protein [Terriglobia bacterium]|jgi:serine/threonine protein kinase